jgi:hypothetical protein
MRDESVLIKMKLSSLHPSALCPYPFLNGVQKHDAHDDAGTGGN